MSSSLLHIAREIMDNIVEHIDVEDLIHLRATCRRIENSTFHAFATRLFTVKRFFLTHECSLRHLVEISKHPLGEYLRVLHLGFENDVETLLGGKELELDADQTETAPIHGPYQQSSMNVQFKEPQRVFFDRNLGDSILMETFQHLQNVHTIEICAYRSKRPTPEFSYWGKPKLSGYFTTTIYQPDPSYPVNIAPDLGSFPINAISKAFFESCLALSRSHMPVRTMKILSTSLGVDKDPFTLLMADSLSVNQRPMLLNLTTLHLTLQNTHERLDADWFDENSNHKVKDPPQHPLIPFLESTPMLEKLTIDLQSRGTEIRRRYHDTSITNVDLFRASEHQQNRTIKLQHLREFSLSEMETPVDGMIKFLKDHAATLRRVALIRCYLGRHSKGWAAVIRCVYEHLDLEYFSCVAEGSCMNFRCHNRCCHPQVTLNGSRVEGCTFLDVACSHASRRSGGGEVKPDVHTISAKHLAELLDSDTHEIIFPRW